MDLAEELSLSGRAEAALGADGPLAAVLSGFSPRSQQMEMARRVAEALEGYGTLVCEAETGTGKTFAYLVPSLLSGKKVILSTGTKNLQEQLFHRDLPLVRKALGQPVRTALLKGRANYLCRQRLAEAAPEGGASDAAALHRIQLWSRTTRTGDVSELTEVPESSPVWRLATSTVDNCLGGECPEYGECFVVQARRAALEADVVVVNHHLFLADMALREDGFGELLPGVDAVVLDEAHQVPDTATQFFGVAVSSGQFLELSRDSLLAYRREARDVPDFPPLTSTLERAARDFRLALGRPGRSAWAALAAGRGAKEALTALEEALAALRAGLEAIAERGLTLQSCHRRAVDLAARLAQVSDEADESAVRWLDVRARGFVWHRSPLEVADVFAARQAAYRCAWVFTSATLAVGESFEHFASRLGLVDREEHRWESPFDFKRQALCYLPVGLPEPREGGHTAAVVEAVRPVLAASRGRAFLLFTSHAALREAAGLLGANCPYPLLVQGDAPKAELLRRFSTHGNAVLLGTSSFWEGVDVRGEALSCVVIDKLPFAAPGDPLLQARLEALRARGLDPFRDYQVPQAVIGLKQGAGRLIRDEGDRGVLVLCDPRLLGRGYGRAFLRSLPPAPLTRDLADVQAFFGANGADGAWREEGP